MKKRLVVTLLGWNFLAFSGGNPSPSEKTEFLQANTQKIRAEEQVDIVSSGKEEELVEESEKNIKAITARMLQSHPISITRKNDINECEFPIHEFEQKPTEEEKNFYESVLGDAPQKVQSILFAEEHLEENPLRVNRLLLVGEPGTGKSTLAKAIGCHLGKCFFVPSTALLRKHRNATSEQVNSLIKSIVRKEGKSILILDEINKLTDNFISEYNDSSQTSAALWTSMDAQQANPNFFLIGTTNISKKMPPQLQSRFRRAAIQIKLPGALLRKKMIQSCLAKVKCSPSMHNDQYLDQLVEQTKDLSLRDMEQVIWSATIYANVNNAVLTKEALNIELQEGRVEDEQLWDFSESISDEERRHRETVQLQKDFHEDQVKLQKEGLEIQKKQEENTYRDQRFGIERFNFQREMQKDQMKMQEESLSLQKMQVQGEKEAQQKSYNLQQQAYGAQVDQHNYQINQDMWNRASKFWEKNL